MKDKCSLCNIESIIEPVQKLPNNAVEIIAIHPDKTIHKWVEYPSIESVGRQPKKIDPRIINCPKCHKRGRINGFNNYQKGYYKYVVVHEKLDGTWGKDKTARRRRCYIGEKETDLILKRLGRYIERT